MREKIILITGATGFIGGHFFKYIKDYKPFGITRQESTQKDDNMYFCDLNNLVELNKVIQEVQPDVIFHFAALTNPQRNEKHPEDARRLNVGITDNLLKVIDLQNTHVIFLSTDKVFNGLELSPDEESKTDPLWLYGSLKLECENIIEQNLKCFHIVRLPIVHSLGKKKNLSFIDDALINLGKGYQVNAFDNVKRCYVKLDELSVLLEKLIHDSHYGIYHAGSAMMSYYERIKMLCMETNCEKDLNIVPIKGKANPITQNLNSDKIQRIFNVHFS